MAAKQASDDRLCFAVALLLLLAVFATGILRTRAHAGEPPRVDPVVRGGF